MPAALAPAQRDLITEHDSDYYKGLTSAEASSRRHRGGGGGGDGGGLNNVRPPINCPKWVCCLLPCIGHIPSMKLFKMVHPEDAEVLRGGTWVRYDSASLVGGDVIRLYEGDVVPADCAVLSVGMDHRNDCDDDEDGGGGGGDSEEVTVDAHNITGESKPRAICGAVSDPEQQPAVLYYGSRVLDGACIALVTATGENTLLSRLIREGRWPPKHDLSNELEELEMQRRGGAEARGPDLA